MKRFFALILLLTVILCLFGCSAGETVPDVTTAETVQEEQTDATTEEETTAQTTEPAFDLSTWQGNYDQGLYCMEKEDWQEAIAAFDAAIALDPAQADAYAQRGNARILSGETDGNLTLAEEDYRQALTLDEDNALALLGIVDIHIRREEFEDALTAVRAAVEKTSDPLVAERAEKMENGFYPDSSGTTRLKREQQYVSEDYLGHLEIVFDKDGNEKSAEAFDPSGKSVVFLELSTSVDGNVTIRNTFCNTIVNHVYYITRLVQTTTTATDGSCQVETVFYDRSGALETSECAWYDAEVKKIKEECYDADNKLLSCTTYEYDAAGNMIRSDTTMSDGGSLCTTYEYDAEGRLLRENDYRDGSETPTSYMVYLYDESGRRLGHELYDGNGTLLWSSIGG